MEFNGEEIDQNLYLGLAPLLPNPSWHNSDLPINPFSPSTQPSFMEEDPLISSINPILPSIPNYTIYRNPNSASQPLNSYPSISPSSSNSSLVQDQDDSSPILPNHQTDSAPGLPAMLIRVEDLMISRSGVPRISPRDRYQEFPQLRFQRLMEVNRTRATVLGAGYGQNHSDTSPETLMNNILALEASRKERLRNGKGLSTKGTEEKSGEGACQCGGNFECNICFETSMEPVVTPCGHLFCWRCLYKWMRTQMLGITECPVCKGEVTEGSLTPIYGRGGSSSAPDSVPEAAMEEIPPRPSGRRKDSTRQLMRREREVRGRGFASQEVERVRRDLEAVLARLRQMPQSNRGGTNEVASGTGQVLPAGLATVNGTGLVADEAREAGGEARGEGDEVNYGAVQNARGELHARRRRRYR